MIGELIEFAYAADLVLRTRRDPDGCDVYLMNASPSPITVWVRPDGRFSRAAVDGALVTLGQVVRSVSTSRCGVGQMASAAVTPRVTTRVGFATATRVRCRRVSSCRV